MSKTVNLTPEAREELRHAVDWHDLGEELFEEVDALMERIGTAPESFAPALESDDLPAAAPTVRQALLLRFRYRLVFFELPAEVRVVPVAHMSQEPGYWKHRLPGQP